MKKLFGIGACVLALALPASLLAQARTPAAPPGPTTPIKVKPGPMPPGEQKPDGTPGKRGPGPGPGSGGTKVRKG